MPKLATVSHRRMLSTWAKLPSVWREHLLKNRGEMIHSAGARFVFFFYIAQQRAGRD
jgi:hypothetical protein